MQDVKQTIYNMLTENTGCHMLDSGGAYGRNWQRNEKKTLQDFENEPAATLEIDTKEDGTMWGCYPTVNVFHKLTSGLLELDTLCNEYNVLDCNDWNGEFYGTSQDQCFWLEDHCFVTHSESPEEFNTYNWDNNFTQVLQGQFLEHEPTGDTYLLLQIHGGCDVRGGYTDAKLFKCNTYSYEHYRILQDDCGFSVEDENGDYITLDWMGEFIDNEGSGADDEYILKFAKLAGVKLGESVTITGDLFE